MTRRQLEMTLLVALAGLAWWTFAERPTAGTLTKAMLATLAVPLG